ncbi:MAG: MarR family transcriptional regulator [Sphingomonadales bacterium]|nr:MarR family transcriptional regulator [Sphingomonadales bacterium]
MAVLNVQREKSVASPTFLAEADIRRGVESLYFGYSHLTRSIDEELATQGLGRAHHRALYFIARQPDLTVSDLLKLLAITKQSLGRVLNDLAERALVESRPGPVDRRQKLLRLTKAGVALEARLFSSLRDKMAHAYDNAGEAAVTGFWHVLEGPHPRSELDRVIALQRGP